MDSVFGANIVARISRHPHDLSFWIRNVGASVSLFLLSAMATVTLRSLHGIPSATAHLKYQKCPSLSSPFSKKLVLRKQKSLAFQISPVTAWRISAYTSAPYTESDTEIEKQEEEEKAKEFVNQREGEPGEEVVPVQPAKAESKWFKKDKARLYVGNLPYSATSNELSELFSEAGTVTTADVRDVRDVRVVTLLGVMMVFL